MKEVTFEEFKAMEKRASDLFYNGRLSCDRITNPQTDDLVIINKMGIDSSNIPFMRRNNGRVYRHITPAQYQQTIVEWCEEHPERPKTIDDLAEGDEYYYIDEWKRVHHAIWNCSIGNKTKREFGNMYLTEGEAEHAVFLRMFKAETEAWQREHDPGFVADFKSIYQSKYRIVLTPVSNLHSRWFDAVKDTDFQIVDTWKYFSSELIALEYANHMGKEKILAGMFGR